MRPTDIIALTAVVVAGLAIVVGAAVQLSLAAFAAGRERRRHRYEELIQLYAEIGEAMSAFTDMAAAGFGLGGPTSRRRLLANLEQEEGKRPAARRMRHLGRSLRLHDADLRVWAAYQDWIDYSDHGSALLASGRTALTPDDYLEHLDALLRWFYKVAGDDARSELKTWPARAKNRAMHQRHKALSPATQRPDRRNQRRVRD